MCFLVFKAPGAQMGDHLGPTGRSETQLRIRHFKWASLEALGPPPSPMQGWQAPTYAYRVCLANTDADGSHQLRIKISKKMNTSPLKG